jgi:hypothetical protein
VGKGHYRLVVESSGPCEQGVEVYERGASGEVKFTQSIDGFAQAIRPLNGNGKDELVIGKQLVEFDCASITVWPAVYRFEKGKYAAASRDFPAFCDHEVPPHLKAEISECRTRGKPGLSNLIMIRDKILRVLGRKPTAGLGQAANGWRRGSTERQGGYTLVMDLPEVDGTHGRRRAPACS